MSRRHHKTKVRSCRETITPTAFRLIAASVLLIGLLSGILGVFRYATDRPPTIVRPTNLNQLEPDVAHLVRTHVQKTEADPWNSALHGELGLIFEANRMWQEASASFTNALSLDPENVGWRLHLAIVNHEMGDFETAQDMLMALVQENPDNAPAQQRLGHMLVETGEFEAAANAFQSVIQLEPTRPEGYVGLADVRLRDSDVDTAVLLLERAIQLDATYRVAHNLLGTAYHRQGRSNVAARQLKRGQGAELRFLSDPLSRRAERYATNVKARIKYGVRQLAQGNAQQAADAFEKVLRAQPNHVVALNNLAGAYARLGRNQEAYRLLLKARERDDLQHSTHINLATWTASQGRLVEALEHATRAVELAPWIPRTHVTRIQVLLKLNRLKDAKAAIDQALAQAGRDPAILQLAASLNSFTSDSKGRTK